MFRRRLKKFLFGKSLGKLVQDDAGILNSLKNVLKKFDNIFNFQQLTF